MTAEKKWKRAKAWRNVLAVLALLLAAAVVVTGFMAFRPAQAPEETDPTGSTGPRIPENFLATTEATTEATTQPTNGEALDTDRTGSGSPKSEDNNNPPPANGAPPANSEATTPPQTTPPGDQQIPQASDPPVSDDPPAENNPPADSNIPEVNPPSVVDDPSADQ